MEGLALVEVAEESTTQERTQERKEETLAESREEAHKAKPVQKAFDSLDAVLKAMSDQDEQLKVMKGQISEMLATNAALKRGVKQIVQDAAKNGSLEDELQMARKKLAMLKTFING